MTTSERPWGDEAEARRVSDLRAGVTPVLHSWWVGSKTEDLQASLDELVAKGLDTADDLADTCDAMRVEIDYRTREVPTP